MWSANIVIDGDGQNMAFNLGLLGKKELVDFCDCGANHAAYCHHRFVRSALARRNVLN